MTTCCFWRVLARSTVRLVVGLAVASLMAASACSADASDGRFGDPLEAGSTDGGTYLRVRAQVPDGDVLVVDEVGFADGGGYVAVYADGGGSPGELLGVTPMLEGTQTDVEIDLDGLPGADATSVYVMLHLEDNDTSSFDHPVADAPVQGVRGIVALAIPITLHTEG